MTVDNRGATAGKVSVAVRHSEGPGSETFRVGQLPGTQPRPWLVNVSAAPGRGRWTPRTRGVAGPLAHVNWFTLAYWLLVGVVGWRWRTGPERAIRLNMGTSVSARD
jgi:hypothetical protein